jgi:Zn-dependent protease with chaperone function
MTHEQFAALVQRLEPFAQKNPAAYKVRLGLLAALGYAYLLAIVVVAIGLVWGLVAFSIAGHRVNGSVVKLVIFLAALVFMVLRAMWVRLTPPEGYALTRAQVPQLFGLIDELTQQLNALPVHHVILTDEFNAAVTQVPRFGLFGWPQSYLILGLPLLQALSPEQFKAVLAHEFGHLSGNHSRFSAWIYRVRRTWGNILDQLSGDKGSWLFTPFFNWYVPFFNAYSFVLARANEYEADRCARDLTSPATAAAALVNVSVRGELIDRTFWKPLYQQANHQSAPPAQCFTQLSQVLRTPTDPQRLETWLNQSLNEETGHTDTHPCLRDRLAALGYSPEDAPSLVEPLTTSAADRYLATALPHLRDHLSQTWQTEVNFGWNERYSNIQEQRQELAALAGQEQLSRADRWTQVGLTYSIHGDTTAQPLLTAFLQDYPDHDNANYLQGELLLAIDNPQGIEYLERAVDQDFMNHSVDAYQCIYSFLTKQGRKAEADSYRQKLEDSYEKMTAAQAERNQLLVSDSFKPADLDAETREQFLTEFAKHPVKSAYWAQKIVEHFPEKLLYVLLVERQGSWAERRKDEKTAELTKALLEALVFPGESFVLIECPDNADLCKRIKQQGGEPFYRGQ